MRRAPALPSLRLARRAQLPPDWETDGVGVWRYRGWPPAAGDGVTLGEGGTPLARSRGFGTSVNLKDELQRGLCGRSARPRGARGRCRTLRGGWSPRRRLGGWRRASAVPCGPGGSGRSGRPSSRSRRARRGISTSSYFRRRGRAHDVIATGCAACVCFEEALAAHEAPEALEGLAWASYCLDDDRQAIGARERA